jgi:phosphoglycerate dehydrogenase-like enzyme
MTLPHIVVEDDVALRPLTILLDPECSAERVAAYADYVAHDLPDLHGWAEALRDRVPGLVPCRITLVSDQAALRAALPSADVVVVEALRVGAEDLALAPRIRLVQKFGTVTATIDGKALSDRGIPLALLRRRTNIAVAEHGFALLLALAKRLPYIDGLVTPERLATAGAPIRPFDRRHTPNANWGRVTGLRRLQGSSLGLLGFGEIGREAARIGNGFGMDVFYHQRSRQDAATEAEFGVSYATFDDVLCCDAVMIQLPSNAATQGLIDAAALARMRPGALLINTSRAAIVDRDALEAALRSGHLGGVGVDVLHAEPAAEGDPLLSFDNFLATPHLAGGARLNALCDMAEMIEGMHALFD